MSDASPDTALSRDVLDDLRDRLARTRLPPTGPRTGDADGVDRASLDRLLARWRDGFDWRAREARWAGLDHRRHEIDGLRLHALHVPATRELAPPILLVHGWPGSFLQMLPLAERLARRRRVIVPSLPGFGFSDAPREPGWNLARTAAALDALMSEAGHARYAVHGSDFGVNVALWLGAHRSGRVAWAHVAATHLEPSASDPDDATDEERLFLARARTWYRDEGAYNDLQGTKPETLAVALADSPAGTLAWIVEKHMTWGVPGRPPADDDLLEIATLYWATGSIASSLRLYREERLAPTPMAPVRVPLAVSQPAAEEYPTPGSWWRRLQPVTSWERLEGAAHFPESEAPDALAARLEAFGAESDA